MIIKVWKSPAVFSGNRMQNLFSFLKDIFWSLKTCMALGVVVVVVAVAVETYSMRQHMTGHNNWDNRADTVSHFF